MVRASPSVIRGDKKPAFLERRRFGALFKKGRMEPLFKIDFSKPFFQAKVRQQQITKVVVRAHDLFRLSLARVLSI